METMYRCLSCGSLRKHKRKWCLRKVFPLNCNLEQIVYHRLNMTWNHTQCWPFCVNSLFRDFVRFIMEAWPGLVFTLHSWCYLGFKSLVVCSKVRGECSVWDRWRGYTSPAMGAFVCCGLLTHLIKEDQPALSSVILGIHTLLKALEWWLFMIKYMAPSLGHSSYLGGSTRLWLRTERASLSSSHFPHYANWEAVYVNIHSEKV